MGRCNKINAEPLVIDGRPGFYNVFIARYTRLRVLYGFTELEERFVSLLPIIDFIIDSPELSRHLSFMEKLVINDFYRTPAMTFALVGFYDEEASGFLEKLVSKPVKIPFSTTQWYGWEAELKLVDSDPYMDFIFSYSRYMPSTYRPEVINSRFRMVDLPLYYCNAPAFGGWTLVRSHKHGKHLDKPILLPPNFFNRDDPASKTLRNLLFLGAEDTGGVEPGTDLGGEAIQSRLIDFAKRFPSDEIILPHFRLEEDKLRFCYMVLRNDEVEVVKDWVYESEGFVIDPFNRYRGRKYRVYFSLWNAPYYRKGFSLKINLNFMDYLMAWSRMYLELRYGGKLVYSSSSSIGLK